MSRKNENSAFICASCGKNVLPLTNGSYRNHCSFCLYSLHLDNVPGDRASGCNGLMEPAGVVYNSKKGYQIRHKCQVCGVVQVNRIAENTVQPDNMDVILKLMKRS